MKRDPHAAAIPLTGRWKYKVNDKRTLEGSFWSIASALMRYRKANRKDRSGFEQCQMDVLVAERKRRGLACDPPPVETKDTIARIHENRFAKIKRGCRSCGH